MKGLHTEAALNIVALKEDSPRIFFFFFLDLLAVGNKLSSITATY